MIKLKCVSRGVALAALCGVGAAQAGLYVGIGGGATQLDPDLGAGLDIREDGRDAGLKLLLGKRLSERSSVELYYADLGTAELDPGGNFDYRSVGLAGLWDVWRAGDERGEPTAYVSLGVGSKDLDAEGVEVDADDWLVTAGVGARVPLRPGVSLRAALEMFDGDAGFASATLVHAFGGRETARAERAGSGEPAALPEVVAVADTAPAQTIELDTKAAQPARTPAQPEAVVQQLANVYFHRDSAFISDVGAATLDQLLQMLRDYPNMRLEIQGHADPAEGGSAYALSELRAQRASNYLWKKGIDHSRLSLIAYGASQPAASGDAELNRRVQFRILALD